MTSSLIEKNFGRESCRQELAALCAQIGLKTPMWLQGAGGNVSRKFLDGQSLRLWIKASGYRVDAVTKDDGLAEVDLATFYKAAHTTGLLPAPASDVQATKVNEESYHTLLGSSTIAGANGQGRPSMETGFHAMLAAPWVVHLHALSALLMAHVYQQYPEDLAWVCKRHRTVVLPALMPGLSLTWATARHAQASHIILANHGVVLALQHSDELASWQQLEYEFCDRHGFDVLTQILSGDSASFVRATQQPIPLRFYFPDTAVFFAKLQPCLRQWRPSEASEPLYVLETDDQDLQEIWAAQQILYAACPELPSLPEAIVNSVASLPTEQLRLAKIAS